MKSMPSLAARLRCTVASFLRTEEGSATVWNLIWLTGFAVMSGLAIDSTNAWRIKTMLASTADVAALAGAWDLPENYLKQPYRSGDYATVENSALDFAGRNMEWGEHGSYMQSDDVYVGHWDKATRTFTWGENFAAPNALPVNAVRVFLGRNTENDNNVQTALLRMIGFGQWEINTTATAMYGVNSCYLNGIISRETLFVRSNAQVLNEVCLHGQLGVNVRPNGQWANPAALTTGETPAGVVGAWQIGNNQTMLGSGAPVDMSEAQRTNLYPPMVDQIVAMGYSMLSGHHHYRHFTYPASDPMTTAAPQVIMLPRNFSTVTGTVSGTPLSSNEKWWRGEDAIQVASLDGLSDLAALLGLSAAGGIGGGQGGGGQGGGQGSGGVQAGGGQGGGGQGGGGQGGGGQGGPSAGAPELHDTYTYNDATQRGNSNQFTWPAETGNLNLTPSNNFNTTTTGAPTTSTATLTEQRIYFADQCQGGKLTLSGTVRNVTIVTNCKIDISGGTVIENAVLLTTDTSQQAVQISNGSRIGAITACQGWGGVRIYSNGDIRAPSSGSTADSQFWGAQLIARDTIHFAAQSDSSKGISLLAGGTIDLAAQARIGALDATQMPPNPVGGCPEDGVGLEFDRFAYEAALVD